MWFQSIATAGHWWGFFALVFFLLILDLCVFHRNAHSIAIREALLLSVFWIVIALSFDLWLWSEFGLETALLFLTGYLVEKALSVDNLFVFLLVFSYFQVPDRFQHRVLFYGILGAMIMRGLFVFAGAAAIQQFHWLLYIFGALLVFTGIRFLRDGDVKVDIEKSWTLRVARRSLPLREGFFNGRLILRENGRSVVTTLFLVLIVIEATDVIFAVDSIPAIFAITTDPYIVFASNVFAILGLRALYFVLSGAMVNFPHLRFGLAFILIFIGGKMLIEPFFPIGIVASLVVVGAALILSLVGSKIFPSPSHPPNPIRNRVSVATPNPEPPPGK